MGTIPVTVNQLTKKLGVNEDIAAFGASLGANLGMPGCAGVWPTLLAVFTIHLLGIDYTPVQYAFLVVLAVVVSIGTVGVPGTATITATALFAAAGLPVEAIILLSPISSIADMARTATTSSALPPLPPLWRPPRASWTRLCTMARPKHLLPRQSEHFSKCF